MTLAKHIFLFSFVSFSFSCIIITKKKTDDFCFLFRQTLEKKSGWKNNLIKKQKCDKKRLENEIRDMIAADNIHPHRMWPIRRRRRRRHYFDLFRFFSCFLFFVLVFFLNFSVARIVVAAEAKRNKQKTKKKQFFVGAHHLIDRAKCMQSLNQLMCLTFCWPPNDFINTQIENNNGHGVKDNNKNLISMFVAHISDEIWVQTFERITNNNNNTKRKIN